MSTAIIGTAVLGSAITRQLALGGESLRLWSTGREPARRLAAEIGLERLIRTAGFAPAKVGAVERSGRLEVGGDLHDLLVGPAEARSLVGGA